jgi:glycosyltransferase involved in cell wall biosynthesis
VANALIAGFAAARGDVVVTSMADLSDPPSVIPLMAAKIREEGADVVSGSRYMRGGSQRGGPRLKRLLSRLAGLSLHYLARLPTHDATTNFRAYSRHFLDDVAVESERGFEVALELTTKAHRLGYRIDEVPSSWDDRRSGTSKFDLVGWLPAYLRWYARAMWAPLLLWTTGGLAALVALQLARRHRLSDLGLTWVRKTSSSK